MLPVIFLQNMNSSLSMWKKKNSSITFIGIIAIVCCNLFCGCNFEEAGKVVMPHRGSETFISAIGHLDGRIDLYTNNSLVEGISESASGGKGLQSESGNRVLMDLCMMASKLAYENTKVVSNVVNYHWKARSSPLFLCLLY